MRVTSDQVITKALTYVGVKESPPNSNNVVFNTDYYGHQVNDQNLSWCCVMWWDIFRMLDASEMFFGSNKTASCTTLMNYGRQNGLFIDSGYKAGDLVFFNWKGTKSIAQHIGMVLGINKDGSLHTLEGNTAIGNDSNGGEVMLRDRLLSAVIGGYRPQYLVDIQVKEDDDDMISQEKFNEMLLEGLNYLGTLPPDDWSKNARNWAELNKYITGDEKGNKKYKKPMTKEEVAQLLYNILNERK